LKKLFILDLPVQGELDPWRAGLVNTATAMNAPTKRTSKMISSMRSMLPPPFRRQNLSIMVAKVYRTAAARMPSTAPLECEALWKRRTIFERRMEKRMSEVVADSHWKTRRRRWMKP